MKQLGVRAVKKLVHEYMNNKKQGISVSLWQQEDPDDIDRIVIKFPRTFSDHIGMTPLTKKILRPNGFHVAQIMGFMQAEKLWILLIRNRGTS